MLKKLKKSLKFTNLKQNYLLNDTFPANCFDIYSPVSLHLFYSSYFPVSQKCVLVSSDLSANSLIHLSCL